MAKILLKSMYHSLRRKLDIVSGLRVVSVSKMDESKSLISMSEGMLGYTQKNG